MTPPIAGRLDAPKPGPQELPVFYRLHRHWRIAERPLPAPLVIHRRRVAPLLGPPEAARFAPTRINRLHLDELREIEVCLQRIDDAVLIPAKKGFCLLQGERIHPLSPAFPMFRRSRLTIARSFERLAYTGDTYTSDNIAHFLLDAMVRGYFAKALAGFAEHEIGFSASRLPYCSHFRSVGFPGAHVLEWDRAYHVEALYIFVHLHHPAQAVFRPALDFLAGLGAAAAGRSLGRYLYVSRRDRARRRLVNEAELEARLAQLGFRIVVAGELAPEDQVAAFRDAAVVVAPHGAALTNALFMSPGARLVELFGPEEGTLALLAIAKSRGVAHETFIGEAVDAEGGTWSVDVDAVVARLHHLVDRPASAATGTEVADAPAR